MAYEDPIFDYEDPNGEEKDGKRGRGCIILVSIVVIVAMIGVSFPSLFWLISLQEAAAEPIIVTVEVSATPRPTTEPVAEEESTAVPPPTTQLETAITTDSDVNRIAYVNMAGHIVTISPNGSNAQILTSGNHRFQFPAWSPDGTRLAVIGQNFSGSAVYLVDAAAEEAEPTFLYKGSSDEPFYLYWAPDGEQIGFIANDRFSGITLHVVQADGSEDSRVIAAGSPFYWHWTDDSERMLIHAGGSGFGSRVQMITAGDGDPLDDDFGDPGLFQSPGISANGRYLAFAEEVDDSSHITIIDTVNGTKQVEGHFGSAAMNWSPTDSLLAYISGDNLDSETFIGPLRLMDAETGEVTVLSRDEIVAFFWSPDGRYIAALGFVDSGDERDINVANPKGVLAKPSAQFRLPELELVIYDVTTMEGKELLRFVPSLPFLSQFLPFFDQYALSHQIWSPESDALVLPMLGENFNQIVVVSIQSGEERLIAEGNMPFWSHR